MRICNLLTHAVPVLTPLGTLLLERSPLVDPIQVESLLEPLDNEGLLTPLASLEPLRAVIRVTGLPDEIGGVVFIVPQRLAEALPDRTDLFYPMEHPNGSPGLTVLVHGASLVVLRGDEILRAEHPEDDDLDIDEADLVPALDYPVQDVNTPAPAPAPKAHTEYTPGNTLLGQQFAH